MSPAILLPPLVSEVAKPHALQEKRLAQCPRGTWPQSEPINPANDVATPLRPSNALVMETIKRLIQKTEQDDGSAEYGTQQLNVYRGLRDLIYESMEEPRPAFVGEGATDAGDFVEKLWKQYEASTSANGLALMTANNPLLLMGGREDCGRMPGNPNETQPLRSSFDFSTTPESKHQSSTNWQQTQAAHDRATIELARGYDICESRAREAWTTAKSRPAGEQIDLMAYLGKSMADWCASYKPSAEMAMDLRQRCGIYGVEDDNELQERLSQLQVGRGCPMKGGLDRGMSPHRLLETVMIPGAAMVCDSPAGAGAGSDCQWSGDAVWPNSLVLNLTVWADYLGADDAKSTVGAGAFDILAATASALAAARGPAADEIKATVLTIFGAQLGHFRLPTPAPALNLTQVWRSRAYDSAYHTIAAGVALSRGGRYPRPIDERCLDLAAATTAVHDCIDCEADAANANGCNLVLISAYKGVTAECVVDTIYATLALSWTSTDVYSQLLPSILQEQLAVTRWGGPVYAAESRVDKSSGNLWRDGLSHFRIASVLAADILPTTSRMLTNALVESRPLSWHERVQAMSARELLASPFAVNHDVEGGAEASMDHVLSLSKGTLVLVCCTSCSCCGQDPTLALDNWWPWDLEASRKVMQVVKRIRGIVDGPLRSLRAALKADHRPDAVHRLMAEAFTATTSDYRWIAMLLEALVIEDALYHGSDVLGYCTSWVPLDLDY